MPNQNIDHHLDNPANIGAHQRDVDEEPWEPSRETGSRSAAGRCALGDRRVRHLRRL
jgi:hypothetical protein